MTDWASLLGLPLENALENTRALGLEPRVLVTCAPRRKGDVQEADERGGTQRVIRVRQGGMPGVIEMTVSAFQDGDPVKP